MPSRADELQERAQRFAVRVVRFCRRLPSGPATDGIIRQLVRSATSESANYSASRRARSRAEFVAKLGLVAEEADESEHWLEIVRDAGFVTEELATELTSLINESRELRAIFVQSVGTARKNYRG